MHQKKKKKEPTNWERKIIANFLATLITIVVAGLTTNCLLSIKFGDFSPLIRTAFSKEREERNFAWSGDRTSLYIDREGKVLKMRENFTASPLLKFVPFRRRSALFIDEEKVYQFSYLVIFVWLGVFIVVLLVIYYPTYRLFYLFLDKLAKKNMRRKRH